MAVDQITLSGEFEEQGTNVFSAGSTATPSVNTDLYGGLKILGLAVAITSVTVTGAVLNDLQRLVVRILDNGTARAIAWGAQFEDLRGAGTPALPATTVAGKRMTATFLYSVDSAKWGLVALAQE